MNRRDVLRGLGAAAAMACVPGLPVLADVPDLAGLSTLSGSTAEAAQRPFSSRQLTVTSRYELGHPVCKEVFQPWLNTLRVRSHQRLNGRLYAPNLLCSDTEVYQAVQVDNVSIGVVSPGAQVPPFPVNLLFDQVLDFPSAEKGSQVLWEMYNRYSVFRNEFSMVRPLWGWVSTPSYIHTVDKPVHNPGDVAGLKLAVLSVIAGQSVETLGGIPVEVSTKGLYHALKSGLVDGALCPFPPIPSFGLLPYLKFSTVLPLHVVAFYMVMNHEIWLGLAAEDKRLVEQTSGMGMARLCGQRLDVGEKLVVQQMRDAGHVFIVLNESQRNAWIRPLKDLNLTYVDELRNEGLMGDEPLLEDIEILSIQA